MKNKSSYKMYAKRLQNAIQNSIIIVPNEYNDIKEVFIMARTANVMTRIEPEIKEQAEIVLSQLGISMSSAMEMYLRQIALLRKIPFEIKLPTSTPIALGALNDEEFTLLMDKAAASYASGACVPVEDFEKEFIKEIKA